MAKPRINKSDQQKIDRLIEALTADLDRVERFQKQLFNLLADSPGLADLAHSFKGRVKSEVSLRDKLKRKILESKEAKIPFDITPDNLFQKINDLVGIRILHLYPRQIREIDEQIRKVLDEERLVLRETPFARTWDDEYREFFESCGFETQPSRDLYTSVHYVVESGSRFPATGEIQVRTLMEEVWGEVDHTMNYPNKVDSLACREQLKVLARVTSSATRLVDSIFLTFEEHRATKATDEEPKP